MRIKKTEQCSVFLIIEGLKDQKKKLEKEANLSNLTSIPHAFTARLIRSVRRGTLCDF